MVVEAAAVLVTMDVDGVGAGVVIETAEDWLVTSADVVLIGVAVVNGGVLFDVTLVD